MCVVVCIDMHNFVQAFVHRGLNKVYLRKRKKCIYICIYKLYSFTQNKYVYTVSVQISTKSI